MVSDKIKKRLAVAGGFFRKELAAHVRDLAAQASTTAPAEAPA
jgi:hypothetical protein